MNGMHEYRRFRKRIAVISIILTLFFTSMIYMSLITGAYGFSPNLLIGGRIAREILIGIRLPRVLSAVIVGSAIAIAGAVMQCVLRNPLASPYTLGVSQGAAFGASFAILVLGAGVVHRTGVGVTFLNPYVIPFYAFLGAVLDVVVVLGLARIRNMSPEAIVLAGVAMGAMFHALTMLLQYFAVNEILVAASLFWMFGDVGRPYYPEITIMIIVVAVALACFARRRWDYNSLLLGDDVAKSVGVEPSRIRLEGMILASLATSVCVSFTGIIGFVGLIAPHIIRITVGGDYRYLLPLSALTGSTIVLVADLLGRTIISPAIIPVGIVTSFIGAPTLIYLLLRGEAGR